MGKKKSSRSVVFTIIVTVIVLCALTYAGIRFLLPIYAQGQDGAVDTQYEIYQLAVKVFPLLVGLVLIIIASLIASNREDDEDEEDKLPPNSYEKQLFDVPNDDPDSCRTDDAFSSQRRAEPQQVPERNADGHEEEDAFVSVFDAPSATADSGISPEDEGLGESDEVGSCIADDSEIVRTSDRERELLDAISALGRKIDSLTDALAYEDGCDGEESPDEDGEDGYYYEASEIDGKIDRIMDAISGLAAAVSAHPSVIAAPIAVEASAPSAKDVRKPDADLVQVPAGASARFSDDDASDPMTLARIEFDSAKEEGYDISYAVTATALSDIQMNLGDIGDAYDIDGRTLIVVPFLSREEAIEELDRLGVDYEVEFIAGGTAGEFNKDIASRLDL